MLDAYIIEEIKKQEEERRRREEAARPRLRIEIPGRAEPDRAPEEAEEEVPDGVPPPVDDEHAIRIEM